MAGRKQVTDEELELNKKMIQIGREDGALEAKRALETVGLSNQLGLISGRAQAFKAIRLLTEFLEWKQLVAIVDNKEFLRIPGVKSLDHYLESLGLGRTTMFNNLKIARKLEVEEVQLLGQVGFTRKDLLSYASLPDEKRIEIREGKVINIEKASREEIQEIIEDILQKNHEIKEEAAKTVKAKDNWIRKKQERINKQEEEIAGLGAKLENKALELNVPVEEVDFCERVDRITMELRGFLAQVRGMSQSNIPGPTAAMRLLSFLNEARMEFNVWYDTVYSSHAPANAAPEEEWTQPE